MPVRSMLICLLAGLITPTLSFSQTQQATVSETGTRYALLTLSGGESPEEATRKVRAIGFEPSKCPKGYFEPGMMQHGLPFLFRGTPQCYWRRDQGILGTWFFHNLLVEAQIDIPSGEYEAAKASYVQQYGNGQTSVGTLTTDRWEKDTTLKIVRFSTGDATVYFEANSLVHRRFVERVLREAPHNNVEKQFNKILGKDEQDYCSFGPSDVWKKTSEGDSFYSSPGGECHEKFLSLHYIDDFLPCRDMTIALMVRQDLTDKRKTYLFAEDLSFGELGDGTFGEVGQETKTGKRCYDITVMNDGGKRSFVLLSGRYQEHKSH